MNFKQIDDEDILYEYNLINVENEEELNIDIIEDYIYFSITIFKKDLNVIEDKKDLLNNYIIPLIEEMSDKFIILNDEPMFYELVNNYIDSLQKDGMLHEIQCNNYIIDIEEVRGKYYVKKYKIYRQSK